MLGFHLCGIAKSLLEQVDMSENDGVVERETESLNDVSDVGVVGVLTGVLTGVLVSSVTVSYMLCKIKYCVTLNTV